MKRQEKIIDYLEKDGSWLTGKELAYLMSVSDRTIRSDVGKINDFYGFNLIQSNRREGYRLSKGEMTAKTIETPLSMAIPQTANERALFLLKHLLVSKKEINLIRFISFASLACWCHQLSNDTLRRISLLSGRYTGRSLLYVG